MSQAMEYSEEETLQTLYGLAVELQALSEQERLKTLRWVVEKETKGEGSRFWLVIAKVLLARPDLIPHAINISTQKSNSLEPDKKNMEYLANQEDTPYDKKFLNTFFQIIS